ncbi:unnamed protein product, partial [Rotaria sp. Silwood2]
MDNPGKPLTLSHLLRLFDVAACTGKEMDSLVEILKISINFKEDDARDMNEYLVDPNYFGPMWQLYFNPLIIQNASGDDGEAVREVLGHMKFVGDQSMKIVWSDGREDTFDDGHVAPRSRIDEIVHQGLKVCGEKEKLMTILGQMQLRNLKANFVFTPWLRLFSFLKEIKVLDETSEIAKNYITHLLLILELLANYKLTQKYIFQSDVVHIVLQDWLQSTTEQVLKFRMIEMLLKIGYSTDNNCEKDIAQFFVQCYDRILLLTNFNRVSPFGSVILFINQIMDESLTKLLSERLIEPLFNLIEATQDTEELTSYSWHILSLSKEITKDQSRNILKHLLLPYSPNIIGLLGNRKQMQRTSVILLRELLDLSTKEKLIFDELIQNTADDDNLVDKLNSDIQQDKPSFFGNEQTKKTDITLVRHSDFHIRDTLLNKLKNAESSKIDQILRLHIFPNPDSSNGDKEKQYDTDRLVLTNTALENVSKILEVLDDPISILLEGSTGVGKSASIIEAAKQSQRTLLRMNMSSRITIDDLLGKVILVANESKPFEFVEGPFTTAFSGGHWILLDELNLAQDTVLQAIESALDTHCLMIRNPTSAEHPIITHSMHENFRLFATQNPNTGFFKGKREKLSPSFLSRFRPIVFKELPDEEWCQIVTNRLVKHLPDDAKHVADLMVKQFHVKIRKKIANIDDKSKIEIGAHAEITIRELLKWVDLLIWQTINGSWPSDADERFKLLSLSAWCVYGARFRDLGRSLVYNILTDDGHGGWGSPSLEAIKFVIDQKNRQLRFDNVSCAIKMNYEVFNPQTEWIRLFKTADLKAIPFDVHVWESTHKVHVAIHQTILHHDFISAHGIHRINLNWLYDWLISATRGNYLNDESKFLQLGCQLYTNRFRHKEAQKKIVECFKNTFSTYKFDIVHQDQTTAHIEVPYVLTSRNLTTLKQVCFNRHIKQPILVTGAEGCGKSELLLTLAWLIGESIEQLNITPETEPSALIGQMIPNTHEYSDDPKNSNRGKKLIWENGCVTKAFLNGHWVLLDNLNVAESSVLERMNPILEQKPMLILSENNDLQEQIMHKKYQLVATMTPPDARCQSYGTTTNNDLSPALYNRFAIVHMPDIVLDSSISTSSEIMDIAKALLSDETTTDHSLAVDLCREILRFYEKNRKSFPSLTLRNFVRLLDSVYHLQLKFYSEIDFISSLWTAYHVTIANQIKDENVKSEITKSVQQLLTSRSKQNNLKIPIFLKNTTKNNSYILTPSRENYANAVLGAVACNLPILLEGPAAVGKTALISDLFKTFKSETNNVSASVKIDLERVNNSDTTTVQDYLGTYLPTNGMFVFQKGALYRAMENGWWFLADEFNLADPSVMSMLFPLLEGKNTIMIPSTGKIITAKAGFQFFATQNDASYANRHPLPVSLRNRFLEVQFDEFPENELAEIIDRRRENGKQRPICMTQDCSVKLSQFYHRVLKTPLRITFRELIKWIHRHAVFSPKVQSWPAIGVSLLGGKYPLDSEIRKELITQLSEIWPSISLSPSQLINISQVDDNARFSEGELNINIKQMTIEDTLVAISPDCFQRALIRLAFAAQSNEPVLLVGPTSCKTLLVEMWAQLSNRSTDLLKVHLTPDIEASDLIGQIQPYSPLDLLKRLPSMIELICHRLNALCRQAANDAFLNDTDHEFFIESQRKLIKKLNELINQYEQMHSEEQENNDKKNEADNNQEAPFLPAFPQQPQTTVDVIENPTEDFNFDYDSQDFSSWQIEEFCDQNHTQDGDSTRINENFTMKNGQSNDKSSMMVDDGLSNYGAISSSTYIDDGLGGYAPVSSSTHIDDGLSHYITISSSAHIDDGLGGYAPVSSSTCVDDGLGEIAVLESSSSSTSNSQSLTSVDDGLSFDVGAISLEPVSDSSQSLQPTLIEGHDYPTELVNTINQIIQCFQNEFDNQKYSTIFSNDKTLQDFHKKLQKAWNDLKSKGSERSKQIFLFNDGPVTTAAKRGGILFLEDIDLPSQAIIERLNSMLEPSPTFALTEDITSQSNNGQLEVNLPKQFQVFASVHQDQIHQVTKLSPATRSRFTEIYVTPYTDNDLRGLLKNELKKHVADAEQLESIVDTMFSLRRKLHAHPEWKVKIDVRLLLRWTDFIINHPNSTPLEHRMLLGARFFYFDQIPISRHGSLFQQWLDTDPSAKKYKEYEHIFHAPTASHGAMILRELDSKQNDDKDEPFPFEIGSGYVRLRYTGVSCPCVFESNDDSAKQFEDFKSKFRSISTSTLLNQIARIFAAISSKTPLLLEGPPGIGKTHVVTQVCSLLNKKCERINMSANTSLDQLIGCVIPRIINGVRTFQWQQGRILVAITEKKWILLDELNLASPEVLQGLTTLFYRGVKQYTVPSTGQVVNLEDTLIFATMNPSTVGGGRNKLPNSIGNLFTIVQLEQYSTAELRLILNGDFQDKLEEKKIDMSQLDAAFGMHCALKTLVQEGKIGRTGGPYELNLRDLTKFRDVFCGSIDSQLFHYRFMNTASDDEDKQDQLSTAVNDTSVARPNINVSDARILSIRKFAQVAYASQFQGKDDFNKACSIIHESFPINSTLSKRENDCSIDTAVPSIVRIGSIYIPTGRELPSKENFGLIHTRNTVRQLELLAAACQSGRTILLEGDICSRKSSLVIELSRLTRHRLLIIALHENFETSDLIGSWLPKRNLVHHQPIFDRIDDLFERVTKIILLLAMPVMLEDDKNHFYELKNILVYRKSLKTSKRMETIFKDIDNIKQIVVLIEQLGQIKNISREVKIHFAYYVQQLYYFEKKLTELKETSVDQKNEIGFEFVESEFIKAIREGSWVLLDNINSAPPDVLERLNSLTEEKPMLSLYEKSDGNVLSKGAGIHEDFRLFSTANLNRIYSNRLSSAFLNRVIRIWLPVIDEIHKDNNLESDLYELLSNQLMTVPGGKQFAQLLVTVHNKVKQDVEKDLLKYPTDFSVTYRLLEQCVRTLISLVERQVHPVDACYWSILRCYCSSIENENQYRSFVQELQRIIEELNLYLPSTVFSSPSDQLDQTQPIWQQDSQRIRSCVVQLEKFMLETSLTVVHMVARDEKLFKSTRELLCLFIDNLLLPMKPNDTSLNSFRRNILNDDLKWFEFQTLLEQFTKEYRLTVRVELTQSQSVSTLIDQLRNDGSKWLKTTCDQLTLNLEQFISNTSFKDYQDRFTFLRRVMTIIELFERCLSQPVFDSFPPQTSILQLSAEFIKILRPILKFKGKYRTFQIFQDKAFVDMKQQFQQLLREAVKGNDGLLWSFERVQAFPIRLSRKDIRKLVEHIINGDKRGSIIGPIQHFTSLLEWIGLQWMLDDYLSDSVRHVLQDNVAITQEFFEQCELKSCSIELIKKLNETIKQVVNELPNELDKTNTQYLQFNHELQSKETDLARIEEALMKFEERLEKNRQSQDSSSPSTNRKSLKDIDRQGSIFNSDEAYSGAEHDALTKQYSIRTAEFFNFKEKFDRCKRNREQILSKAKSSRLKLNENMKTINRSEAYRYVQMRFEQPDSKQLSVFIQILNEAKQNPALKNSDGLLDIRAVLSTSFGQEWIQHENLLDSPLTFFSCGYYFLPDFNHDFKLHIISDWNQLGQDLDLRYCRKNDLTFFCPSKEEYQCSLLFVENQPRTVKLHLLTLQGDISTDKLEESLKKTLPESIQYQIDQKELPTVDNINTESIAHRFAIASLLYLRRLSDTTNIWVSEIYQQTMKVFNQLKDFVERNTRENQAFTSIFQNMKRFDDELNYLDRSSLSSNDPWVIDIEEMWKLIKKYQNLFSTALVQNFEQQLRNSIRSVESSNMISRIMSLGYLETTQKYSCIPMISSYLREGLAVSDKVSIKNYYLLFDFIKKIDLLLKLITQHFIYLGEQFSKDLYKSTPDMIAHFDHIFQSTLKVIDIENNELNVGFRQSKTAFQNWQEKLNDYLAQMKFPSSFLAAYNLTSVVNDFAPLFDINDQILPSSESNHSSRRNSFPSITDSIESRKQTHRNQIEAAIQTLTNQLSRASQMDLRPQNLIEQIHLLLQKLRTFDVNHETEESLHLLINEEKRLIDQLDNFDREIKQYTTFQVNLPNDDEIIKLSQDNLTLKPEENTDKHVETNDLKGLADAINQASQVHPLLDLSHMIRLTHAQVSDQTWLKAMNLLRSMKDIDELRKLLMMFRDDLAMEISEDQSKFHRIVVAYSQFRHNLLIEESNHDMLMNYEKAASLSKSLEKWMTEVRLNAFNMFETIKSIGDDLNRVRNQLKNFPHDAFCCVLPIDLRPDDVISLLAPEYSDHVQMICQKFTEIDGWLSGKLNQIEPTSSSLNNSLSKTYHGLSTFQYKYPTDPTMNQSLFHPEQHIHYIVEDSMSTIRTLLDTCTKESVQNGLLMKSCTSAKELFPLHLSLALTLLIMIDRTGQIVNESSPYVDKLMMNTLKHIEQEIVELKTNIDGLNKQWKKLRKEVDILKKENDLLEKELEDVKQNRRYLVSSKEYELAALRKRRAKLEEDLEQRQSDLESKTKSLKGKEEEYQQMRASEQRSWCETFSGHLKNVTEEVHHLLKTFLCVSTSYDEKQVMKMIEVINEQQMIHPKVFVFDNDVFKISKDKLLQHLDTIKEHARKLEERDTMRLFIEYYSHIMMIALKSFDKSLINWKIFVQLLETSALQTYADENKKNIVCRLAHITYERFLEFLDKLRSGHDQNEMMNLAREIALDIRSKLKELDYTMTGKYSRRLTHLSSVFERFIGNFLITGCRYCQLQRGSREPLDDVLTSMKNDDIDKDLPRNEVDLLKLLETYENQMKSHSEAFLYQNIHLAFEFNSNSFGLFDQLDRSIKVLIQLILPSAYLLKRTWITVDTLITQLPSFILQHEHEILNKICNQFLQLTEERCGIQHEKLSIKEWIDSKLLEFTWKYFQEADIIFIKTRPNMKVFFESLWKRWHSTMKAILKGLIETQKIILNNRLEANNRKQKSFTEVLSANETEHKIVLADIERVLT